MMQHILLVLFCIFFYHNSDDFSSTDRGPKSGFLYLNISKIYTNKLTFSIKNTKGESLCLMKEVRIYFDSLSFDIIEEDFKYRERLKVEVLEPEYGLLIFKCIRFTKDVYVVLVNNQEAYIEKDKYEHLLKFKTLPQYLLSTYPIPSSLSPIRMTPSDTGKVIEKYDQYTYTPLEVTGDWIKVKTSKDCYSGETLPKKDITGWIRWGRKGKMIIKLAYRC
ncbi:hypothetical protein QNI16_37015 [Cytophagaceae bacterium YF14B1]|uniref:Uncharacterized protein n=1 Tax=Xanthocytophaga flava TaxID=3048013 RepID=A0AAE3R128_9BACT|nr:hypothetical protein [Xanthocytophaga flavus]MDJ1486143.1 hypothetical protein [Xanthocytophaga flavus]